MIALAVMTDGRREFIEQTIPRLEDMLRGPITARYIFDDSADPDYAEFLADRFAPRFEVISWGTRRGFGGTYAGAWGVLGRGDCEYVWGHEDDFWLDGPVEIGPMIELLDKRPHLDQVALLRHAFFPREHEAGGIIQEHPASYIRRQSGELRWLEHRRYFTTNPSLYRRELCAGGWPDTTASEQVFTKRRVAAGQRFAFWGHGEELVTHIGSYRAGTGY